MAEQHEPSNASAAFESAEKAAGAITDDGRPVIRWVPEQLPEIVDQAEHALMLAHHDVLFQRGATLVRVVRRQPMTMQSMKLKRYGGLGISVVDKPYLVEQMTRAAAWEKFDARQDKWKRTYAPEIVATTYMARTGHWKLPPLAAVISTPTLRPDGSVLQTGGYDEATATWYDPGGIVFPRVPEKPTQKQAAQAADELMTALKTVPFVAPEDMSVMISMMLTALVRKSLPTAPLGAFTAPTPSSGKTMLADCVSILATGVKASAMNYPSSDEDAEKVALALLAEGDAVALIDNIARPLRGDWLCSILTSETYKGRRLGKTEMIEVPTAMTFLATGNRLVIEGDLRTRALLCRIDPRLENPQERKFEERLTDTFTRRRIELVIAGLTVIRAYVLAGEAADVFRESRFPEWSRFCREPLMWLGLNDPLESYKYIAADDPKIQEHLQVVLAWKQCVGMEPKTAKEIITAAIDYEANADLRDALSSCARDRSGNFSSHKLAAWLHARAGVIVQGMQLDKSGTTRAGVSLWKFKDDAK